MEELRFFKPRAIKKYQRTLQPPAEPPPNDYIRYRYKYNSIQYADLFNEYKSILKSKRVKDTEETDVLKDTLTYWQFQVINLSLLYNPFKVLTFMDVYMYYGCWVVFLTYIIASFVVAMPLYFLVFFMGYYSKQRYMTFWLSLPILKGIGIAIAVSNIFQAFLNMAISSLALYFSINWLLDSSNYCGRKGASSRCIDLPYKENCTKQKIYLTHDVEFVFPSLNLLEDTIFDKGNFSVNFYWILCSIILWMVILLQLLHKPTRNIMLKLNGYLWIFLFIISLIFACIGGKETVPLEVFEIKYDKIRYITFWSRMIVLVSTEVIPGDILTYVAKIKKEVEPNVEASVMFIVRCLVITIVTNWVVFGTNGVVNKFELYDTFCLRPGGINTIFALIPELLKSYTSVSKLTVPIYFLLISYWALMSTYFSVNGFLEALHSQIPKFSSFRYLCLVTVWVFTLLNSMLLNNKFKYLLYYHRHSKLYALYLLMSIGVFIILYTPRRIVNDYQFTFGVRIGSFWRESLKFYTIIIFVFGITFTISIFQKRNIKIVYDVILLSLILFPILYCAITKTISYKTHKTKYLVKPDYSWGPPSEDMREARRNFNAKLRLNESLVCNHDCALHSELLDAEIDKWLNKEKYFNAWYYTYEKAIQIKKRLKSF